MKSSVTIVGTPELEAKLKALGDAVSSQHLANAVLAGALVIEGSAKEKAPVRTGNLRRSIHSAIEESTPTSATATIGTDVFYAPFQEWGTIFMGAHPFLRPALDEKQREAMMTIRNAFAALIEGAVH